MSEEAKAPEPEGCVEVVEQTEFRLNLGVNLTAERLVKALGDSAPMDALMLTTELDEEVGLWAYSILVYRHFFKQMEIANAKCPELLSKTDEELLAMLEGE